MTQYDETNRGSIWPNKKKETEKHPDFTGSLNVAGKDYWVSAWRKKPDAAERAPSLTFQVKPKDGKPMGAPRQPVASGGDRDMNDEIPW